MVVIGLFTQLWSGLVSLVLATALGERLPALLHGVLLALLFLLSLVCLLVAFVFAANSSADTALRISSSILILILGKHAAVPVFKCLRVQQLVKSGIAEVLEEKIAELKERVHQEGDASLAAGGAIAPAEDDSQRTVGLKKTEQYKEDGEGKQQARDEEHAASAIQVALKQKQKQNHKKRKQEDGEKTGENKKNTEKARGEADAAEQDGQKMGEKKTDTEKARGEPDAAEQDKQKTDKKKKVTEKARREAYAAEQDGQKMGPEEDRAI